MSSTQSSNPHLRRAEVFAEAMDSKFSLLGVNFGYDVIIGIIPGLGSVFSYLLSMYLFWVAYQMKVPLRVMISMMIVLVVETILGGIPFLGFFIDIVFKANIVSLKMLQAYERNHPIPLTADE